MVVGWVAGAGIHRLYDASYRYLLFVHIDSKNAIVNMVHFSSLYAFA